MDWREHYLSVLRTRVREPFKNELLFREFIDFLVDLERVWWHGDPKLREKYAYNFAVLEAVSEKPNVVSAKLNAFYAYLVYKGYVSAYRLMRDKYVAGGESIYTWLRMYRELTQQAMVNRWTPTR